MAPWQSPRAGYVTVFMFLANRQLVCTLVYLIGALSILVQFLYYCYWAAKLIKLDTVAVAEGEVR